MLTHAPSRAETIGGLPAQTDDRPGPGDPPARDPRPPLDPADLRVRPGDFPQPAPSTVGTPLPARPEVFADYGVAALPWLQGRTSVDAVLPLFSAWRMPPIAGGARLHIVDTDGDAILPDDGRSALVIIFTDPPSAGLATGHSNLVVYEPLADAPGRFRIVYDHGQVETRLGTDPGRSGIIVRSVEDVTGDGQRDISFEEIACDGGGCRRTTYVLTNEGTAYRRLRASDSPAAEESDDDASP